MSISLTILDANMKPITLFVNKTITIGELKKLFKENGGEDGGNPFVCAGEVLTDENKKLKQLKGYDPYDMSMNVSKIKGLGEFKKSDS